MGLRLPRALSGSLPCRAGGQAQRPHPGCPCSQPGPWNAPPLSLAVFPVLLFCHPRTAHPAPTPRPLWVPTGCFSAQGTSCSWGGRGSGHMGAPAMQLCVLQSWCWCEPAMPGGMWLCSPTARGGRGSRTPCGASQDPQPRQRQGGHQGTTGVRLHASFLSWECSRLAWGASGQRGGLCGVASTGPSMSQEAWERTGLAPLTFPRAGLPQPPKPGMSLSRAPSHLGRNLWTEDVGSQAPPGGGVQGRGLCSSVTSCSLPPDFKPNRGNRPGQCCSHPSPERPRGRWLHCPSSPPWGHPSQPSPPCGDGGRAWPPPRAWT